MLIDTHAHLNFRDFRDDADEVIRRSLDADTWMINIGTNYHTSQKAIEIAQKYEKGVYAAIGLHPINLDTGLVKKPKTKNQKPKINIENLVEKEFDYNKYRQLAQNDKVIAIGEIGLDYYWRPKTKRKKELFKEKQKELFLKQLDLAKELNLPVILHCRMAHQDLIEIQNSKFKILNSKYKGVMHSFVGTIKELEEYLELGFYIGFNGIIFKKIDPVRNQRSSNGVEGINFEEIIKKTPLARILLETDCPYLAPPLSDQFLAPPQSTFQNPPKSASREPHKSAPIRNEPLYVKYIAGKIAKIKNDPLEKLAEITTENAKNLFNLRA